MTTKDTAGHETPLRFSILGDSFSAFEGYVDPETNDPLVAALCGSVNV
jgi:hypothetical protein